MARAEIISVGTEILLGEILNSNAKFLASSLKDLGINHYFQTVVGDNEDRMKEVIAAGLGRADILIFTGGLGPTPDDMTHEVIASYFGMALVERPEVKEAVVKMFEARGRTVTASNFKQANLPAKAQLLHNPIGTAWGIWLEPYSDKVLITMPGVPSEMVRMWNEQVIPRLSKAGIIRAGVVSRDFRLFGVPESLVAEKLGEKLFQSDPTVATYAETGGVRVRVAFRGDEVSCNRKLDQFAKDTMHSLFGESIYSSNGKTLAEVVAELLLSLKQNVSVAESCTGGWLGHMLTDVVGSSNWFSGGLIAYSNNVKQEFLGVKPDLLKTFGVVSPQTALEMAKGIHRALKSHWAISITGIAGPDGGSELKPVGLVYIGIIGPEGLHYVSEHRFGPNQSREYIRRMSTLTAINLLRLILMKSQQIPSSIL